MKKALLVVDMQNDFMPSGKLPVASADILIKPISELMEKGGFDLIIASQDCHPQNHISFKHLWPVHCVENSKGAAIVNGIDAKKFDYIQQKGGDPDTDSYSAFMDNKGKQTGLNEYLKKEGVYNLYICGVATDYCVKQTGLDALSLFYNVHIIRDLVRGVTPESSKSALLDLLQAGANFVDATALLAVRV